MAAPRGRGSRSEPLHAVVLADGDGGSVFRAGFSKLSGELRLADAQATMKASVEINSISIQEPAEFRAHLLSEDFFAAEQHPVATFESEPFQIGDEETAIGRLLTLRGASHEVAGTARWAGGTGDPSGKKRWQLTLEGVVDRREFGITWNTQLRSGENQLGDEIAITAEFSFVTAERSQRGRPISQ